MNAEDELARLEARLQCRMHGRVREFRLLHQDHGLILQGRAASYYGKQLAQQAVMEETDLLILGNEIEVTS